VGYNFVADIMGRSLFILVMVRLIEFWFDFDSINRNRTDCMENNRKFRFFPALCMSSGPPSYPSAAYRQRVTPSRVHWASPSPCV